MQDKVSSLHESLERKCFVSLPTRHTRWWSNYSSSFRVSINTHQPQKLAQTRIRFAVQIATHVVLILYDARIARIKTLGNFLSKKHVENKISHLSFYFKVSVQSIKQERKKTQIIPFLKMINEIKLESFFTSKMLIVTHSDASRKNFNFR